MLRSGLMTRALVGLLLLLLQGGANALEIEGVQPAALDQPRINVAIRRSPRDLPLAGTTKGTVFDLLEPSNKPKKVFNLQAFLDTGASGIVISATTADMLGILRSGMRSPATGELQPAIFHDVGVGGGDEFHVSEPLFFAAAPFHPATNTEDPLRDYMPLVGPIRAQVGPLKAAEGLMGLLTGNLDVMGMPAISGKVVVIDPSPVNTFGDTLRTYIYRPGARFNPAAAQRDPGIPQVRFHVRLNYTSFVRFTRLTPANAQLPALARNPLIGPDTMNPGARAADQSPPVEMSHAGKSAHASFLLDTGAAASMISTIKAAELGITYAPGQGDPVLNGVPREKQFTLTLGGIGGGTKAAGFYLDELRIPTREGEPIVFKRAPVLVHDIAVEDPQTRRKLVLDGVLGMNFLVASAQMTEGPIPDIGKLAPGAFEWIVIDEPNATLGLQPMR